MPEFGACCNSLFRFHTFIIIKSDAGQSMEQHFLTSYHHAILSTILAQPLLGRHGGHCEACQGFALSPGVQCLVSFSDCATC